MAVILEDTDLDRQGRINRIREVLKQRKWPALRQIEKWYEKTLQAVGLDKGVQLIAPRFFEGMAHLLTLRSKTPEEPRYLLAEVGRLPEDFLFE